MSTTALDKYIEQELRGIPDALLPNVRALITRAWDAGQRNPEPHQGYRNYETFALGVLLENDADLQYKWLGVARACKANAPGESMDFVEIRLADRLKEAYDPERPNQHSPYAEWLRAGYEAVDWLELARLLLDKLEGKNQ